MKPVLETRRLLLRQLTPEDFDAVFAILGDADVMYAWEHAFTRTEAARWLGKNVGRYLRDGFSYWAAIEKETGALIGLMGVLMEDAGGETVPGVGYLLRRDAWGRGYAAEGAAACARYALEALGFARVTAQIRPENERSVRVAQSLGMRRCGRFTKTYRGKEMPHDIYELKQETNCVSSAERG